jgi:hypothetical protein
MAYPQDANNWHARAAGQQRDGKAGYPISLFPCHRRMAIRRRWLAQPSKASEQKVSPLQRWQYTGHEATPGDGCGTLVMVAAVMTALTQR